VNFCRAWYVKIGVRKTTAFRNSRKMPEKGQKARENTPIL
jgi:hypothetical protein